MILQIKIKISTGGGKTWRGKWKKRPGAPEGRTAGLSAPLPKSRIKKLVFLRCNRVVVLFLTKFFKEKLNLNRVDAADRLPVFIVAGTAAFIFILHAVLVCGAGGSASGAHYEGGILGGLGESGAGGAGAERDLSAGDRKAVAVLLFHAVEDGVSSGDLNGSVITPGELENTFLLLKTRGYNPVSLHQFHLFLEGKAEVPPKAVLITFDDGYADVYEKVLPLTQKYGFPAVVFTVSKWFDLYPRPEKSRRHLTCEEARRLLASGLWSIGGHGYEGHRLVAGAGGRLGPFYTTRAWLAGEGRLETDAEYRARVWGDLVLERAALARAGVQEPRDFAFPYGAFNEELVPVLNEAGYTYLYTNRPGLNRPGQDRSHIYRLTASSSSRETVEELERLFGENKH